MKKFTIIVLIGILFWSYMGFFSYFQLKRMEIRQEVKARIKNAIPDHQLKHFYFTEAELADLHWVEDKEFIYKGEMYDVVRSKHLENQGLELWCIPDYQETNLFADLNDFVHKEVNDDSKVPLKSLKTICQHPFELSSYISIRPLFLEEPIVLAQKNFKEDPLKGHLNEFLRPPAMQLI